MVGIRNHAPNNVSPGKKIVPKRRGAGRALHRGKFEHDRNNTGDRGCADHDQHHAGVFIVAPCELADPAFVGHSHVHPDQHEIAPYRGIPAGQGARHRACVFGEQQQCDHEADGEAHQHTWSIAKNLWIVFYGHVIKGRPTVSRILLALRAPFVESVNHRL